MPCNRPATSATFLFSGRISPRIMNAALELRKYKMEKRVYRKM
jgi:hypothetical protein